MLAYDQLQLTSNGRFWRDCREATLSLRSPGPRGYSMGRVTSVRHHSKRAPSGEDDRTMWSGKGSGGGGR
jgi:hypothetical protein